MQILIPWVGYIVDFQLINVLKLSNTYLCQFNAGWVHGNEKVCPNFPYERCFHYFNHYFNHYVWISKCIISSMGCSLFTMKYLYQIWCSMITRHVMSPCRAKHGLKSIGAAVLLVNYVTICTAFLSMKNAEPMEWLQALLIFTPIDLKSMLGELVTYDLVWKLP